MRERRAKGTRAAFTGVTNGFGKDLGYQVWAVLAPVEVPGALLLQRLVKVRNQLSCSSRRSKRGCGTWPPGGGVLGAGKVAWRLKVVFRSGAAAWLSASLAEKAASCSVGGT